MATQNKTGVQPTLKKSSWRRVTAYCLCFWSWRFWGSIIMGIATPTESGCDWCCEPSGSCDYCLSDSNPVWSKSRHARPALLVSVTMWIIVGAASCLVTFHCYRVSTWWPALRQDLAWTRDSWWSSAFSNYHSVSAWFLIDEFIIVLMCAPYLHTIAVSLGTIPIGLVFDDIELEIACNAALSGFALFLPKKASRRGHYHWIFTNPSAFVLQNCWFWSIVMNVPRAGNSGCPNKSNGLLNKHYVIKKADSVSRLVFVLSLLLCSLLMFFWIFPKPNNV